ncbi:MAG: sugar phosphate nucleotidyltransferase [Candidatus Sumerlaeota bacterium]|nr:sugar phosphate nucleotidyltransferase [Candidatus Sumerlaeota bacterium]
MKTTRDFTSRDVQRGAVAMILAGGQGSRLSVLSEARAKPAVPFAGRYRIIDFTLSNAMHAGLPYVGILTQYRPYSLMDHLSDVHSWGYGGRGRTAAVLPPYRGQTDASWYEGTADAVYQNLGFLRRFQCETTLVLSGDHIYRMDYGRFLAYHLEKDADLTIACQAVPWEEASRFGVMKRDDHGQIVDFQEKPKHEPISNMASLGIYAFRASTLEKRLVEDAARKDSQHDFGNDIIPRMIREDRVFCYEFQGYWRDVGTVASYWDANMEALDPASGLDLAAWDVRTNVQAHATESHRPLRISPNGGIRNSLVSNGCVIDGDVEHSVLSPGVIVRPGARLRDSVVLNGCVIGEGAVVENAILDKRAIIGPGVRIGVGEDAPNRNLPHLLNTGLTVIGKEARVPKGLRVGRNCLVRSYAPESAFAGKDLPSGETVG